MFCWASARGIWLAETLPPPFDLAMAVISGLGTAGCIGLAPVLLAPSSTDAELKTFHDLSGYFTPALFLAPIGALAADERGLIFVRDVGSVGADLYTLGITYKFENPREVLDLMDYISALGVAYMDSRSTYDDLSGRFT